jgi:tryptophan 2,3-dioxygenase
LWFKLVLHELELAKLKLLAGEPWGAAPRLRRAVAVEELLLHHLDVLETMSPDGFLEFRDPLAPASGFQSTQYREIAALSGHGYTGAAPMSEAQQTALHRRAGEPTLWDGLCASLGRLGLIADTADAGVLKALVGLYRDHVTAERASLHDVCELLVDHDEAIARWRFQHALMAAREIGRRPGTGGSLGVAYLDSTMEDRFFPVLWQVRSAL